MFRGVTDLNVNFLGNRGFLPGVFHHVFRPVGVRATHGAFAPSHIPSLRAALPLQISHQDFFASRSISLHGFRATDLPRELARHRNLSACSPSQALPLGHTRQHRQEYAGRCQRAARLSHLHGFSDELIQAARKLYTSDSFAVELEQTVYALDTTTIGLCLSVFP